MTWTLFVDRRMAAPGTETPRELFEGLHARVVHDIERHVQHLCDTDGAVCCLALDL